MDEVHWVWRVIERDIIGLALLSVSTGVTMMLHEKRKPAQEPVPEPASAPAEVEWQENLLCLFLFLMGCVTVLMMVAMWKTMPQGNTLTALFAHPTINILAPLGGMALAAFIVYWIRRPSPMIQTQKCTVVEAAAMTIFVVYVVTMAVYLLNPLMTLIDPPGLALCKKLTGGVFVGYLVTLWRHDRESRRVRVEG